MDEAVDKEILFRNEYVRTEKDMNPYLEYYYFKGPRAIIRHIILLIGLLLCIGVLQMHSIDYLCYFVIVCTIVSEVYWIYWYFKSKKLNKNRFYELENGTEYKVVFSANDESIICESNLGTKNVVDYSKFLSATQIKNFIYLRSKANFAYIFEINSFTKGDSVEFMCFLKSKGVKVK